MGKFDDILNDDGAALREVTGSLMDDDRVPSVLGTPDDRASVLMGSVSDELDSPGSLLDGSIVERVLGVRAAIEVEKMPASVRRSLENSANAVKKEEARERASEESDLDEAAAEASSTAKPGAAALAAGAFGFARKAYRGVKKADRLMNAAQDAGYGGADDAEETIRSEAEEFIERKARSFASDAARGAAHNTANVAKEAGHAIGSAAHAVSSAAGSSAAGQGVKRAASALKSKFVHEKAVDTVRKRGVANVVAKAREFGRGRRAAKAARRAAKAMDAGSGAMRFGCAGAVGSGLAFLVALFFICGLIGGLFESYHSKGIGLDGLNEDERTIALFLNSHDLDPLHIAAIMGNLYQESHCDPDAVQVPGMSGGGIGIMQWGYHVDGGRGNRMENWAHSIGSVWNDLQVQLDWMWAEMVNEGPAKDQTSWYSSLSSPGAFEEFLSIDDLYEATEYWCTWMEGAGNPVMENRIAAAERYYGVFRSGGGMIGAWENPCPAYTGISTEFSGTDPNGDFHNGIDLAAPYGSPTYTVDAGTVIYAGWDPSAGNMVTVDHGGGIVTKYMHHSRLLVSTGDTVEAGQQIGEVGSTGFSTGPHLHFQIEVDGVPVNPRNYIDF